MIAEALNKSIRWADYQVCGGSDALDVGLAIGELLASSAPDTDRRIYWRLGNTIVSQGAVYSSAVPAMQVLTAALVDERPLWVRVCIYDLMRSILLGCDARENDRGENRLVGECRTCIMMGFWLIVRDCLAYNTGDSGELDVLRALDPEIDLAGLVKGFPESDDD